MVLYFNSLSKKLLTIVENPAIAEIPTHLPTPAPFLKEEKKTGP